MNEHIAFQAEPFENYEAASPTWLSPLAAIPQAALRALRAGRASIAVQLAIARGERNATALTDMVFYARHPERKGKRLARGEPNFGRLAKEWADIRARLVRPALLRARETMAPARPGPPPPTVQTPKGDVTVERVSPTTRSRALEAGVKTAKTAPFRPTPGNPRDLACGYGRDGGWL